MPSPLARAGVLSNYVPSIWDQLYCHMECEEEGTRNVVAECLGKLCLMSPEALLPKLKASLSSPSALMRTTVVTAIKFTISDQLLCTALHFNIGVQNKLNLIR